MSFECFIRAARMMAALFLLISPPLVSAEEKLKKAETFKDIIEKAYNLSLQKDRPQAINILVKAIRQENANGSNTAEIKKALQQVSYMFYSDRAQQSYELAMSLKKTDPAGAQQKLNEALRMEPDNLSLFVEIQRVLIIRGECSTALDNVTKERLQDPFDETLFLVQAQAQVCLGKWDAFTKTKEAADPRKSSLSKFWFPLEIEQALTEKNLLKAKELVLLLAKTDPKYPELNYWQWRTANGPARAEFAQKYLKDCKIISPMTYRQYMTDVNLCRKISEVERPE